MRGGLDDALDKLARRDELRRRAAGEAMGTPPQVQDLVEAIAAVVGRNPELTVTVGVEGAGDPVLLHFTVEGGLVQVSADNTVASRVAEAAPTSPRHADFDIDLDDSVEESYPPPAAPGSGTAQATAFSAPHGFSTNADAPFTSHRRPEPAEERWNGGPSSQSVAGPFDAPDPSGGMPTPPFADGRPHRFGEPASPFGPEAAGRAYTQPHGTAGEAAATEQMPRHPLAEQNVMPTPMPQPVPLKVDTAETELAAKRLAALLRDDPTLLGSPSD